MNESLVTTPTRTHEEIIIAIQMRAANAYNVMRNVREQLSGTTDPVTIGMAMTTYIVCAERAARLSALARTMMGIREA